MKLFVKWNKIIYASIIFFVCSMIFINCEFCYAEKNSEIIIHVSVDGNDGNSGGVNDSVRSLKKASQIAAQINRTKAVPITILIHGGEYHFTNALELNAENSGYVGAPITYKAAEGENVVFTGAKKIDISKMENITDSSILARIDRNAQGKVKQIDLKQFGLTANDVDITYGMNATNTYGNQRILFLNDKAQTLAKWPNSGYAPIINAILGTSGENTGAIGYDGEQPKNWTNAKDMMIEGYIGSEFYTEMLKAASIDVEKKLINLKSRTQYGPSEGHRWTAINLLEEIDIPGEWYIDKAKMVLYYYPPYDLDSKKDVLEIACYRKNFISLNQAQYIIFDGITFAKNTNDINKIGLYGAVSSTFGEGGKAIDMISAKNITIKNCIFQNIGGHGIVLDGEYITVEDCDFLHIGWHGILVTNSGDIITLKTGNSLIKNNRFFDMNLSMGTNGGGAISCRKNTITGSGLSSIVGLKIINNLVSNSPRGGIDFNGCELICAYNEMYNIGRESADVGAIYNGRIFNQVGNIIEYNYIHDIGSDKYIAPFGQTGIYWDDGSSGNTARYNIVKPGVMNGTYDLGVMNGSGKNNTIVGNTIIDTTYPVNVVNYWNLNEQQFIQRNAVLYNTISPWIYYRKPYSLKYKDVAKIYSEIHKDNGYVLSGITVKDNLFVDFEKLRYAGGAISDRNTIENGGGYQIQNKDYSIFVNPDKQDYRVRKDKKLSLGISDEVLDEDFDLDLIGLQRNVKNDVETVKLLYPLYDKETIERRSVQLAWEMIDWADEYQYVISKDIEFKDIVETGTEYNRNVAIPKNLLSDETYYWKIIAKNISRNMGFEIESEVRNFSTSKYDILEKESLLLAIKHTEDILKNKTEGVLPGQYKAGSIAKIKDVMQEAKQAAAIELGVQQQIDTAKNDLYRAIHELEYYVNTGYGNLNAMEPEEWSKVSANSNEYMVKNEEGLLACNDIEMQTAAITTKNILPNYEILCFRQKIDDFKGAWCGYAIRAQSNTTAFYGQPCYSVVIKKDIIEFQNKGVILQQVENVGIITEKTWHEIRFGAVNTDTGVKVSFVVDDQTIFEFFDDNSPIYTGGYFQIYPTRGKTLYIAPSKMVPEEIIDNVDRSTVYDTTSSSYVEYGAWEGSINRIRQTSTAKSNVKWTMSGVFGAKYRLYYYHIPVAGGDTNATIRITNNEADHTEIIDMSKGEEGWRELGVYKFITQQTSRGEIFVELSASGKGVLPIQKLKMERVYD